MRLDMGDRYGFTEEEWTALTVDQREIHYNRWRARHTKCDHPYTYPGIAGNKSDERLRAAYSHDPYFHTAHMDECKRWGIPPPKRWDMECHCQMCTHKIGIEREGLRHERS